MDGATLAQAAATGRPVDAEDGEVDADLLAQILDGTKHTDWPDKRRALRLENARVTGRLHLESLECSCPLELHNCQIPDGIDARSASIKWLVLSGSNVSDLTADYLSVDRRLVIDSEFRASGPVRLNGSTVGGSIAANHAYFDCSDRCALDLTGAVVGRSLNLGSAHASGAVSLLDAKLGSVNAKGAVLSATCDHDGAARVALDARNVATSGDFSLAADFEAHGLVRLANATIGGRLLASGARITTGGPGAFDGDNMSVTGSVLFDGGFRAEGEVGLTGAHVGGDLMMSGAILSTTTGVTVRAKTVRVDGRVAGQSTPGPDTTRSTGQLLFDQAEIKGDFDLSGGHFLGAAGPGPGDGAGAPISVAGAQIGGSFDASDAVIDNGDGPAVNANGVSISQNFALAGATVTGTVVLRGATVSQQVNCEGTHISHRDTAIAADGVHVGTDLLLRAAARRFRARGSVELMEASVGADLSCRGGHFSYPAGRSIDARGITVGAETWLDCRDGPSFAAHGQVRFCRAKLTGRLICSGAVLRAGPAGVAFDGSGMSVGASLTWKAMSRRPHGRVVLDDTTVGLLDDDPDSWPDPADPPLLSMDGFTYTALAPGAFDRVDARLAWLRLGPYALQPYQQLRGIYAGCGRPSDASTVAIAKEDDRRKAELVTGWQVPWHRINRALVRYGYRPRRAFGWLAVLIVVASAVFGVAHHEGVMEPTAASSDQAEIAAHCTSSYPCFDPVAYGFDVVVPIIDLGQRDKWAPDYHHAYGPLFVIMDWLLTVAGWFVATMAVAGVTGWLSPDPKTG